MMMDTAPYQVMWSDIITYIHFYYLPLFSVETMLSKLTEKCGTGKLVYAESEPFFLAPFKDRLIPFLILVSTHGIPLLW